MQHTIYSLNSNPADPAGDDIVLSQHRYDIAVSVPGVFDDRCNRVRYF